MDLDKFKKKLEEERAQIEDSLLSLGKKNPENPDDWEATPADLNIMVSDPSELADSFEEFQNRAAIETELEERLNDVKVALEKIKKGKYGICEKCKEKISDKRLEAYPAAKNCIKHA